MANNNPQKTLIWSPNSGGINSDTDIKDMRGGNLFLTEPYTGAVDVRAIGAGTNVSPSYEAIKSNKLVFNVADVAAQNQIIVVKFQFNSVVFDGADKSVDFDFTLNGQSISSFTSTVVAPADITAFISGVVADITAAIPTALVSGFINAPEYYGEITIELTDNGIGTNDWRVLVDNFVHTDSTLTLEVTYRITQEAISDDMLGEWNAIGSNDNTGDLVIFWTTRTIQEEFDIVDATDNGSGLIRIETSTPHGLTSGVAVAITSVGGTIEANGIWVVTVISATEVDLLGSNFTNVYTTGGLLTTNPFGLGEIGVAVKDENDQTWTYTTLLRSKEFNFITSNQIDCRTKQKQDGNTATYFTQGHDAPINPPRVFYYKKPYITDGALVINGGIYEYGSISSELQTQVIELIPVTFVQQIQSGGGILSGNTRYSARGLTENLTAGAWSELSNPVPAASYSEQGSPPNNFFGDIAATTTGKQNVLEITNPVIGLFKYVEIAAINYVDGGFTGEIIGRYLLTGDATQLITHTGLELNKVDLDTGELNNLLSQLIVKSARNVELYDQRQILSNLMINTVDVDLTPFAETFTWSLQRSAIGGTSIGSFITGNLAIGEWMFSENVYRYASLMLNERYRFGFYVEWTSGGISPVIHLYDIIPNTDNTQLGCTGALASFDLTDNSTTDPNPYTFFVDWAGYNLDLIIEGKRVRDWIKKIHIVRCEVNNPQVIASGIIIPAVNIHAGGVAVQYFSWVDHTNLGSIDHYGEFPFVAGVNEVAGLLAVAVDYGYGDVTSASNFTTQRKYGSFYAPDFSLSHTPYPTITAGDIIKNFGQSTLQRSVYVGAGTTFQHNYIAENIGLTGTPDDVVITEGALISRGESATINGVLFSKKGVVRTALGTVHEFSSPEGIVVYSSADQFDPITANPERAIYNAQYFRTIADGDIQYGVKSDSKYISTGSFIEVTSTSVSGASFSTFGGDCFTQKSWLKDRYPDESITTAFGQGFGYYSQNRANFQMRSDSNAVKQFPNTSYGATSTLQANGWLNAITTEPFDYNEGYTIRNEIVQFNAFDVNRIADYQKDWGNAIIYSSQEVEGSVTDGNRNFPPLNIKFLDYTNGEITELKSLNGELITLQPSYIERQFFNTTASISTQEGQEILLGGAPVFSHKGVAVNNLGCSHKWSVEIGLSDKGNQVLYFYSERMKALCRVGYDGSNSLDLLQGIKSFIANNTRFIIGKDKPAHDEGINTVSCQRFREVNFTFVGYKAEIEEWLIGATYDEGQVVAYGTVDFSHIPQFYISTTDGNIGFQPDISADEWTPVSTSDGTYYNFFTLVWSELKNVFQCFHTPCPKIYFQYKDTFLAPRPISDTGTVFEFNRDDNGICQFWDDDTTVQVGTPFFDAVFNEPKSVEKTWLAIRYSALQPPLRTEFYCTGLQSYLDFAEFTVRENYIDSPIKNDSTVTLVGANGAAPNPTGVNNIRTSKLWDFTLIVRTKLQTDEYNVIDDIYLKHSYRARFFNT